MNKMIYCTCGCGISEEELLETKIFPKLNKVYNKEKIGKVISKLEKLRELYWFSDTVCKYANDS